MARYSIDLCIGGTASADSVYEASFEADKACDDNNATGWRSSPPAAPHWWKYDFGSGKAKIILRYTLLATDTIAPKAWTFAGSNNDSDWTTLDTQTGQDPITKQTYIFINTTAYRYYRIYITTGDTDVIVSILEIEMMRLIPAGGLGIGNPYIF